VEDHYETRLIYEKSLRSSPWQIIAARSIREAENVLRNVRPVAIVLDVMLQGEDSWDLLAKLKSNRATRGIPVLVATTVDDRGKALALGADAFVMKPLSAEALREHLAGWTAQYYTRAVLLVDDQDISRYLLKQLFNNVRVRFLEENNGAEGVQTARMEKPDLVVMDLSMPGMSGFEAIELMKADPQLQKIPIIVATSKVLTPEETQRLNDSVLATLPKDSLSDGSVSDKLRKMLTPIGLQDLLSERRVASRAGLT
jgi:CheY-like chemotaxis protein